MPGIAHRYRRVALRSVIDATYGDAAKENVGNGALDVTETAGLNNHQGGLIRLLPFNP
jgi:hypothetical protein